MTRRLLSLAAATLARLGILWRPLPPTVPSPRVPAPVTIPAFGYLPRFSLGLPGHYARSATGGEP